MLQFSWCPPIFDTERIFHLGCHLYSFSSSQTYV